MAAYTLRPWVTAGGLLSYGIDIIDPLAARGRLCRSDSQRLGNPVQQPTKYELVINLKTAKALGLDVPTTLLARAASGHAAEPPSSVMNSRRFIR